MIKYLLTSFLLAIFSYSGFAQNSTVKGTLYDTIADSKIPKATVTVFGLQDSIMVGFTRTNSAGEFSIPNIKPGKYGILITHPLFASYSDQFESKGEAAIDLGTIQPLSQEMLLKEVMIVSSDAIKIKGDTIEYVADSFKVKENATVEDLFKKLPGIQVNKNGEITAQGKRVEKVLVDGDEFFSDDPTVATQNLRAESVDKVQVFEKKDELSGATDQGAQTINITLKEDAKKGYFGKLKGSVGTDDIPSSDRVAGTPTNTFYNNEAMINRFKSKQKVSAYLIHSNVGKLNLDWRESQDYGGNQNANFFGEDDNGFIFFGTNDDDDEFQSYGGGFSGAGIPAALNGGATFSSKWNKDKSHVNAAYQYKQVDNDATTEVNSENYLSDTTFITNERSTNGTFNTRHSFNGFYDVKTDSLSNLKITVKGNMTDSRKNNTYYTETLNEEGDFVNTNDRKTNSTSEVTNFNVNANWLKKFKNPERKFNAVLVYNNKSTKGESFLNSVNQLFLANNVQLATDTIEQQKTVNRTEQSGSATFTYKEPISKTSVLEFRYVFNISKQVADRFTFDKTGTGEYGSRIDSLSSQYTFDFLSHRGGINYHFKKDKVSFKIGSDVSKQFYDQFDQLNNVGIKRDFVNFFPTGVFVYSFNKMKQLRFNYNGYTEQPSITQIQPLVDNTDPFNITVGNPDLDPSFTNNFQMQYFDNQVMKGRYLYGWANFSYVNNDVVTSSAVDSFNRNITQFVNKSGTMNAWANMNYYMEFKKIDLGINFGPGLSYSKNLNFINGVENTTQNRSISANVGVRKEFGEVLSTNASYEFAQNFSGSSIQNNSTINYWTQQLSGEVEYTIKKKLILFTNAAYSMRQKTEIFNQNNNMLIWNAGIDYKLFKDESGILGLYVNDILNQNLGFQRNASAYTITQTRYNVIKRYVKISFTWNFNSNKPKKTEGDATE